MTPQYPDLIVCSFMENSIGPKKGKNLPNFDAANIKCYCHLHFMKKCFPFSCIFSSADKESRSVGGRT